MEPFGQFWNWVGQNELHVFATLIGLLLLLGLIKLAGSLIRESIDNHFLAPMRERSFANGKAHGYAEGHAAGLQEGYDEEAWIQSQVLELEAIANSE